MRDRSRARWRRSRRGWRRVCVDWRNDSPDAWTTDGGSGEAEGDWKLLAIDEEEYERTFACKDDARDAIAFDHTIDTALMHDFPRFVQIAAERRERRRSRLRARTVSSASARGFTARTLRARHLQRRSHASSSLTSSNAASTETFSSPLVLIPGADL